MKTQSTFIAAILAASVSTIALAQVANADTPPTDTVVEDVVSASTITVSDTGRSVANGVYFAKRALAEGNTDAAKDIIGKLSTLFGEDDADLMVKTDAGFGLPLDAAIGLAEGFEPTDAHAPAFAEASKLMQAGDIDGAIRRLNTAGVDIVAQIAVLPYQSTIEGLKAVSTELNAGDFEKANAALDRIGASIAVEIFAPDALPTQGYALTDILQG